MWLDEWMKRERTTPEEFARRIGVTKIHFNSLVSKRRRCGVNLAKDIQDFTKGAVTMKELRETEIKGFPSDI